jgi:hypothetical protein
MCSVEAVLNPRQGCQMVYFQTKNSQFGYILEGLAIEELSTFHGYVFYGHLVFLCNCILVYLMILRYTYFPEFWYLVCTKKNLATLIPGRNTLSVSIRRQKSGTTIVEN